MLHTGFKGGEESLTQTKRIINKKVFAQKNG